MKSKLSALAARRGENLVTETAQDPRRPAFCRETSGKDVFPPQNSLAETDSYKPSKTADPIRRPLARLTGREGGKTPPPILEAILWAEIGEARVVRSLRDRPPPRLLAELKRSTGDFAPEAEQGFPRRIKWRHVCGPELSPAQMTDYVETEEDLRLRNPAQPTTSRRQNTAPPVGSSMDAVPSDWKPCVPSDHAALPDLPMPAFLKRTGGDR
jgi:hypothetical protein